MNWHLKAKKLLSRCVCVCMRSTLSSKNTGRLCVEWSKGFSLFFLFLSIFFHGRAHFNVLTSLLLQTNTPLSGHVHNIPLTPSPVVSQSKQVLPDHSQQSVGTAAASHWAHYQYWTTNTHTHTHKGVIVNTIISVNVKPYLELLAGESTCNARCNLGIA